MKRFFLPLLVGVLLLPSMLFANEGMWFLMFIKRLNERNMQKMGLQLTAEEIYSINNHSLKDAIVQFNGGCTASIISKNGLVLTNHHCGYEQIAEVSTPEKNHLKNGFWAKNYSEEIKPKSLSVRFFVRMDDVTKRMLAVVNDKMTEEERQKALNAEISKIEEENSENGKYVVSVRSFFQGNEFYYFVYQDFNDVRLVGTPPENIGKFGGDSDNWEWPRQTGDFSLFRVYTDKNGNAAEYSPENIPMKTDNYLRVNIGGVKEKDFTMIMGYPGTTNRWESSFWVDQNVKYAYPAWVEGSKTAMDAMKEFMEKDEAINLKYTSKYSQIANYWKNRQGMIDALTAHKTAQVKRNYEKRFAAWASQKANKKVYGNVLSDLKNYFEKTNTLSADRNYLRALLRGSDLISVPFVLERMIRILENAPDETKSEIQNELSKIPLEYDNLYIPVEKALLAKGLKLYATKGKNVSEFVKEIQEKYDGNFAKFIDEVFENSAISSKEKVTKFIENPTDLTQDPLVKLANEITRAYFSKSGEEIQLEEKYQKAYRNYVQGLRISKISKTLYPDANSTLRLTYGKVLALPFNAKNADVKVNNHTTFTSLIAKYKPNYPEFDMPKKMIEMYQKNDFGRYLDKDGTMHVNFLTDNDITGGNSGSPVMNGKGQLIGLAFDGNIEAMAGDVIFDAKLQRTISVDIRYVLWVIDKFSEAKHIVDEMTIFEK